MKIGTAGRIYSRKGGIGLHMASLCDYLSKDNDIHFFTSRVEDDAKGIKIHLVPHSSFPPFMDILTFARNAQKAMDKFSFDITHSPTGQCLKQDIFTAHSCHAAAVSQFKKEREKKYSLMKFFEPRSRVIIGLEKNSYLKGNYKKIISVSKGVKNEIIRFYNVPPEDIVPIPNGVNNDEFKPDKKKRKQIRDQFGISADESVLIFVGWEFKRKGLAYIISALPHLREKVKLFAVGKDDPSQYQKLARKLGVENQVIFTGFVKDLPAFYAASDIFVFPTEYEPFGIVLVEAMASGCPVLATRVAGSEEMLEEGKNGFFIERNAEDIAEKLNSLIDDTKLLRSMGKDARKTAKDYSWDKIAKKTLGVYEEVSKR